MCCRCICIRSYIASLLLAWSITYPKDSPPRYVYPVTPMKNNGPSDPSGSASSGRSENENTRLEGFTIRTLDELFNHNYFHHRLEERANQLFWKRVFAWRASVIAVLGVILSALGWFGFNWKVFLEGQAKENLKIQSEGHAQIAEGKAQVAQLKQELVNIKSVAEKLSVDSTLLSRQRKALETQLDSSQEQHKKLKRDVEETTGKLVSAVDQNKRSEAQNQQAEINLSESKKKLADLDQRILRFDQEVKQLGDVKILSADARKARLFRMILLHSKDAQEIGFDVPHGMNETRPISIALRIGGIRSDDFVDLTWDVRESDKLSSPQTTTLFLGSEVPLGDSLGLLTVRLESIRKQPFSRSFIVLTIRAKAANDPTRATYEQDKRLSLQSDGKM